MPDNDQILAVSVEARITKLEREMRKASTIVGKNFDAMERRSKVATDRLEANMARAGGKFSNFGKGAFTSLIGGATLALAPILSVAAAINTVKSGLQEFGDISDSAKASGLDAEFFQGLAYQASLGGVGIDAMSTALAGFARNSGLAAEGKGRMVTALKALNPELLASIQAATTQEQRVKLAADAISQEGDDAKRAALSVALFGDAGAKLADVFGGGAAAIAATAERARDLGLVIDRDLIARADEMGDQFDTATKVMDLQFKQALIDLAPFLIGTAQLASNLAAAINYMTDSMQALSDRGTARLEQDFTALGATIDQAGATMAPGVVGTMGVQIDPDTLAKMQAEKDAMGAELKRRAIDKLRIDLTRPAPAANDVSAEAPGSTGGGGGNAAAQSAIAHGEAVQKLIADLQFEKQTIGETALEQDILNTLRNQGVDAASSEGLAIRGLMTDLDAQKAALQSNADAMKAFGDAAQGAMGQFLDDMLAGKSLAESLSGIFKDLASQLLHAGLQNIISGLLGGGGGGILAGLFGHADGGAIHLAGGGRVRGPGTATSDSIPAMLSDGEHVIRAAQARKYRPLLEAINSGSISTFADGGAVGGMKAANLNIPHANDNAAPVFQISAPITVNGSSGSPEQNADLAAQMSKSLEDTMRGVVVSELARQQRQGGSMNTRSR